MAGLSRAERWVPPNIVKQSSEDQPLRRQVPACSFTLTQTVASPLPGKGSDQERSYGSFSRICARLRPGRSVSTC